MPNPIRTQSSSRRQILKVGATALVASSITAIGIGSDVAQAGATAPIQKGQNAMTSFTTSDGTEIFYKDWGTGQPIVFHHGWPLSADVGMHKCCFSFPRDIE